MSDRYAKFWVGVFVLGAIGVLLVMLSWFGDLPSLFTPRKYLIISFESATGVGEGTPAIKSGIRVGEVLSAEFDDRPVPSDKVLVTVIFTRTFPLAENTQARITRGLLGDTSIEFVGGGGPPLTLGNSPLDAPTIQGTEYSIGAIVAEVAPTLEGSEAGKKVLAMVDDISAAAKKLESLGTRIEAEAELLTVWKDTGKRVGDLAADLQRVVRENEPELRPAIANIRAVSDKLNSVLDDRMTEDLRRTVDRIEEAATGLAEIRPLLNELSNPDPKIPPKTQLAQAVVRINRISADLALLTASLSDGRGRLNTNGSVQRLVSSPEAVNNFNRMTGAITELANGARVVVEKLGRFADKIAIDPSQLTRGALQRN